ncbi:hypothetical protein AVEN_114617-1 [Araneus ventricosus]|uniref:C2H2-type domain-containing protein n=1 Tax=Araneus ventricosus TaxID=182803 RepID=A0A4Y2GDV8_ARAVE|nr:hypothetical protein AVEN_114617-1 [Araneus ventricosus]
MTSTTTPFSDSDDVEWMNEVSTLMVIDEPGSGFGYIVITSSSLVSPSTNDRVCDVCRKSFSREDSFKRHMKKHGDHANHAYSRCCMKFYRLDKLREHMRTHTR